MGPSQPKVEAGLTDGVADAIANRVTQDRQHASTFGKKEVKQSSPHPP